MTKAFKSAISVPSINKMAITAPATSSTLAVANGKTFTVNATITLAGTDGTTITLPTTTGTVALNNQTFYIGTQAITINAGSGTITALPGLTSVNGTTIPLSATLAVVGSNNNFSTSQTITGTATATNLVANATTTGSSSTGAIAYGTLGYSDQNNLLTLNSNVNAYNQLVIQNTSSGTAASADLTISNNLGTASTYYGNFGINSSGYSGTGSLNLANAIYVTATSGDLVLGTTTSNSIRFVLNSGTIDALRITSVGQLILPGSTSGTITIAAPAVSGTNTLTLPTSTGTVSTEDVAWYFGLIL